MAVLSSEVTYNCYTRHPSPSRVLVRCRSLASYQSKNYLFTYKLHNFHFRLDTMGDYCCKRKGEHFQTNET